MSPEIDRARKNLKEGEELICQRQKLIKIVDRSEHGRATVEEYVMDELADDSDNKKRLFRAENRAGRKLKASKAKRTKGKFPYSDRSSFRPNVDPGQQPGSVAGNGVGLHMWYISMFPK